jgi:O-antigen/teichoic acid export membrane protein
MNIKKNTLWNLFGSAVPMLVGIAAIPYIYSKIGIERIGVLTIIWALIGYFSIFDFGLGRAITQRVASSSSDHNEKQEILTATTGVYLTLALGVLGSLVGIATIKIAGINWMNFDKNLDQEIYRSFFLACMAIPAATTTAGLRGVLEGKQRFKALNILKFLLGLSNFLMPVVSIIFFGPRLDYIVGSLVLTRYIIFTAHYSIVKTRINKYWDSLSFEESKQLFKFGGWMTLSNIISPLMVVADRFLIANVLGAAAVAFYTIPADFMFRLLILPAALTTTLFPIFSKNFSENNRTESLVLYKKSVGVIILMMGAICTFVIISAEIGINAWLGSVFAEKSSVVASILAVGIFFISIAQVPHAYIQASGDARSTALIHVFESILYLPLLLVLMQMHGILGAAIAWSARGLIDLILLHGRAMRIS